MCEFVSWVEYEGNNYFLTDSELQTKEGEKLLRPEVIDDLCGHGAIRSYYPELIGKGSNLECVDFSTPLNFPKEIVKMIKQGKMSRIGICIDILNKIGKKKYKEIQALALKKYKEIEAPAWNKYKEIQAPALKKYEEIEAPALKKYKEIQALALKKYEEIEATALKKYKEIQRKEFWKIATQKKYRKDNWK